MLNLFLLADAATSASDSVVVGARYQSFLFPLYNALMRRGPNFEHKFLVFGILCLFSLLLAFLINYLVGKALQSLFHHRKRYTGRITSAFRYPLFWYLLLTGCYLNLTIFFLSEQTTFLISRFYFILSTLLILQGLLNGVNNFRDLVRSSAHKVGNVYGELLITIVVPIVKTALWAATILFIMDNVFHFNIGTLLAGAGVVSMAFVFAAQNSVANLFAAVNLIMDRPFTIGQRIVVDGKDGIVEAIGARSIRLRALDGTLWCIPNRIVADSSLVNFSVRPFYRYVFTISLTYGHTPEQLRKAKEILRKILQENPMIDHGERPPCITFSELAKSSLDLQVVCWILTDDFVRYSQVKDELNFQVLQAFNENGLDFAFPTQTIRIEQSEA